MTDITPTSKYIRGDGTFNLSQALDDSQTLQRKMMCAWIRVGITSLKYWIGINQHDKKDPVIKKSQFARQ